MTTIEQAIPLLSDHAALAALLAPLTEQKALAEFFTALHRAHPLLPAQAGGLVGAVTLGREIALIDRLLWWDVAGLTLMLHCDLYDIVQVDALAGFCGGFLSTRIPGIAPEQRFREAASWIQVFALRLSGHPLTYDYLSRAEYLDICGRLVHAAAGALGGGEEALLGQARGMLALIQARTWIKLDVLTVPGRAEPIGPGEAAPLMLYPE